MSSTGVTMGGKTCSGGSRCPIGHVHISKVYLIALIASDDEPNRLPVLSTCILVFLSHTLQYWRDTSSKKTAGGQLCTARELFCSY